MVGDYLPGSTRVVDIWNGDTDMGSTKSWYVLQSKPRKENQVYSQLCSKSIEAYYPTIRVKPVNPRSAKIRPYFPSYLFVYVDLDEIGVGAVQWIPGVNRLVQFGGEPASIPDEFVIELKRQITRINDAGPFDPNGLKKGDPVRITEGVLAGYEAIFDLRLGGNDRMRVLLELAGRLVKVEVNADSIESRRQ